MPSTLLLRLCVFSVSAALPLSFAYAVDTTLTPAGFTGLSITPNAHTVPWGHFEAAYDNQLPGIVRDPSGHNFVAGFGLFPNLEFSGRVAASNPLSGNCFVGGCGQARDLSVSGKVGIGLDPGKRFRLAAGVADFGGNVTYFRSTYGVLSYNEGPIEISAGLAKRSGAGINGSQSPLDGPFAGLAWQPLPWLRGHVEYAGSNAWGGLRLFAPATWLPEGWVASLGANLRLTTNNFTEKAWLTLGLSVPLYKLPNLPTSSPVPPTSSSVLPPVALAALPTLPLAALPMQPLSQLPEPAQLARPLPLSPAITRAAADAPDAAVLALKLTLGLNPKNLPLAASAPAAPATPLQDSQLNALAAALKAKGLEDIAVGRLPDGAVAVLANSASYKWNSVDALGAALGAIARTLGATQAGYRLILTQRQIPLVAVSGQTHCLRQWLNNEAQACAAGQLSTPGTGVLEPLHAGAQWVVQRLQPSWQTLRLAFAPVLRTNIATELGTLDYSVGINANLSFPLWAGASVEWGHDFELARTDNYQPQAFFADRRVRTATERLLFTQIVRVPLERWFAASQQADAPSRLLGGLVAQGSVGRVGTFFDGVHGALRWEPGEGAHRFTGQAGFFKHTDFNNPTSNLRNLRTAKPLLGSYRYAFTPTRTYFEAVGGQFMNNDRGFQLGLRQWFSDVAVNAYLRRTRFENAASRSFIGLEVSLPLGPRQDKAPDGFLQISGVPRFAHAVETLTDNPNTVTPGHGVLPPVPTLDALFNSDRAGLVYFEDNIGRIRDAAR